MNMIQRKVDIHELSRDSLERMRTLSGIQNRFIYDQLLDWLVEAGRNAKEAGEFI